MLTEDDARALLQKAADTIDVAPAQPLELPRRRPWLAPVAAAAAVLAAVVVGLVVVHDDGASTSAPVDVPTPAPVVPEPNGRIPNVFAYDADSAQKLLESLGLKARRESEPSCNAPDRAVLTSPLAGVRYRPGQEVTLRVTTVDAVAACKFPDALAWKILDFANGRGPDPGFTDDARFRVNGQDTTPQRALEVLSALTRSFHNSSLLVGSRAGGGGRCDTAPLPESIVSADLYTFALEQPTDGTFLARCVTRVFTADEGSIEALFVSLPPAQLDLIDRGEGQTPPEVPSLHDPYGSGLAQQLVFFANKIRKTPFPDHDTVRFYNDGLLWNTLIGDQTDDRDNYSLCSGIGPADCPASYLDAFDAFEDGFGVRSTRPACIPAERAVGERRGGGSMTAYVTTIGGACTGSVTVQIRYDADRLVAVNVISNAPDPERDLRDVADRFIRFARGTSDTPPLDAPVQLFLNGGPIRTLSARQAADRTSYALCSAGTPDCPFDPVRLVRNVPEVPAIRRAPEVRRCLRSQPLLTAERTGGTSAVLVSDVDHPCAWGVQLWVNDVGQVVAVDLRLPRPG